MNLIGKQSRRAFLRQSAAFSGATLAPLALNLAGIGAASAGTTGDYKALVCIYLQGGNDHHNMVVPYDDRSYASYAKNRAGVGVARASLAATTLSTASITDGRQFAFHPTMTALKSLYDQKKVAIVGNAGPLYYPVTNRTQLWSGAIPTPPGISGHPEQTAMMLTCGPELLDGTGWGGRIGDLLMSTNSGLTSMCMSTAGQNWMQGGEAVTTITVGDQGIPAFNSLSSIFNTGAAGTSAFRALQMQQRDNMLESEWLGIAQRSMEGSSILNGAMLAAPTFKTTSFDGANPLASQLQTVAKLIAMRNQLSQRRQIFFVEYDGFDHHGNLVDDHPIKLGRLSNGLASFYKALVELGVESQVTSFTTSDFGRSLTPNGGGGGSDHGWGGHYLVMGGAVKGGDVYGAIPEPVLDTALDWGAGRTVPGVSMEEYHAPLARWMGVSNGDMATVLPNLGRFARPDLGFMTV